MKFKCCEYITSGIHIHSEGYKYCAEVWVGPNFIPLDEDDAFNKNEQRRLKIIEEMKKGIIPELCQQCILLQEKDWDENNNKLKRLNICSWNHCNASCFYCCSHASFTEEVKNNPKCDTYAMVKKLLDDNRIDENTYVQIHGGEPTVLKDFPLILKPLIDLNCKIEVLSNGIKYEPLISEMLRKNKKNIVITSIDCGTRETFKRIKRVDKFDELVTTIKRYVDESDGNGFRVKLKYIILKGVNDNKKEIDSFFDLCKQIGITRVSRAINSVECFSDKTKNRKIEPSVVKMYEYFKEQADKNDIMVDGELWADQVMKNKVYNFRKDSLLHKILSKIFN